LQVSDRALELGRMNGLASTFPGTITPSLTPPKQLATTKLCMKKLYEMETATDQIKQSAEGGRPDYHASELSLWIVIGLKPHS
jgi:hypothetical protein